MSSTKNEIWLAEASVDELRERLKEVGYSAQEVDSADEGWLRHRNEKQNSYEEHEDEQDED